MSKAIGTAGITLKPLKKSGGQGPHYTQKLPAKLPTENVANPVNNLFMTTRKPHGFKLSTIE
ncbi:hypothetical protein [Herbaspirillum lusitanum]|uniref:hypothetical protein n=1 Tax=Herbaspirillum lusitanum TaxID=213312 RepID=UPI0022390D1C|nr:hypothetical protein [Herbaspirillum lusitanum]